MKGLCKIIFISCCYLDEGEGVVRDLGSQLDLLRVRRMVDAALEDAAAVAMRGHGNAVGGDSVIDKLVLLGGELVEALLDDVVSVEVLDQADDVAPQCLDDKRNLTKRIRFRG